MHSISVACQSGTSAALSISEKLWRGPGGAVETRPPEGIVVSPFPGHVKLSTHACQSGTSAALSISEKLWRGPGGAVETRPPEVIVVSPFPGHIYSHIVAC